MLPDLSRLTLEGTGADEDHVFDDEPLGSDDDVDPEDMVAFHPQSPNVPVPTPAQWERLKRDGYTRAAWNRLNTETKRELIKDAQAQEDAYNRTQS